ncbi:MAG TPA: hypothetical protein VLF93_07870 [Candidatus Saccharimonadales bacterium]|nr:hypothetical protein [Candidatus Saccharimonadales bacterium]
MTKKNSKKSTHTHVPTRIGLGIIAIVALAVGSIVVTQYNSNNQTQTVATHAAAPIVKPIAPVTTVNTSKTCISYNTSGKCVMYQTTTTTVNTKSPCLSYNTVGQCTYYQGTNQTTKTFVPTVQPVKKKCTTVKRCLRTNPSGACIVANYTTICK